MLRYIARRLVQSVLVLLGVSALTFFMMHILPGDPVVAMLGPEGVVSGALIEQAREELGLDQPVVVRYGEFLLGAVQGDLGRSWRSNQPVTTVILEQFPATLQLTIISLILATIVGVGLGIVAAVRQNSSIDTLSMVIALVGVSMPNFWLGLLLIFLFSLHLGWIPATGYGGFEQLILPTLALGLSGAGILARLVRSSLLEVLRQEYVVTARSKGLRGRTVIIRHALKNAMIPVVTVLGLQFGALLSGTVIIENVFARQGIGRLAVRAIESQDFPVIQGVVLFIAVVYVLVNLMVDVLYGWLDPRIRYE